MTFTSLTYLACLAVLLIVYWRLGHRWQNRLLLATSWAFYGSVDPWLLTLLLGVTLTSYLCARGMAAQPERRKLLLALALVVDLGALAVFKYADFFLANLAALLSVLGLPSFQMLLDLALPLGISFYTFICVGYCLDVYRGNLPPERDFVHFALLAGFFPTLQSGPIERAGHLLPQIAAPRRLRPEHLKQGLTLLIWGAFQKLVVADNLAQISNKTLGLKDPDFCLLWIGVLAFTMQILADFSGYTDLARGSARLLGFELLKNFDQPYLAASPADFWRRWHMSLSFWLRDYVYIPLGGSRANPPRAAFNILATFFVSGLWHGANWNFIIWGLYHGVLVLLHRWWKRLVPPALRDSLIIRPLKVPVTFLLVALGWLMFRETDLAWLTRLITLSPLAPLTAKPAIYLYLLHSVLILSLPLVLHAVYATLRRRATADRPRLARALEQAQPMAAALMLMAILALASPEAGDFIYSKF